MNGKPPETLSELIDACNNQDIDIMNVLEKVVPKIRDGKHHLLLLGFPIPRVFGGETESIILDGYVFTSCIIW